MTENKRIVIEPNKQPALEGSWTVGEVQAAAEFLARWIASQRISAGQGTANDAHLD